MAKLTKEGYLNHLLDIKVKLSDFLNQIDQGKHSYFQDISLKLRILFIDKSGTKALLSTIQNLYQFQFQVWISYSLSERIELGLLPESIPIPVMEFHSDPIRWFHSGMEKINILDSFNRERSALIAKHFFSLKKIVEGVADKMGGAHIDKTVKDQDLIPHSNSIIVGNLNIAERVLYDTARSAITAIEMIEEYIRTGAETEFIKTEHNNS